MDAAQEPTLPPWLRALLHRWLVEFNPLYLVSAALVLGGLSMVGHEVARSGTLIASFGVTAVYEVYAFALILGAAFLVRRGHRRAAAMLGLIAVLFQGDLMMHVETSALLDPIGKLASALWVVVFAAKLFALAWALELRLSRSAVLVPLGGAVGLALFPHVLFDVPWTIGGPLVALFLFAVASAALYTERNIESAAGWDDRGRRCIRATWSLWGLLLAAHAGYWTWRHGYEAWPLLLGAPFLALRWVRRERTVWAIVAGTLGFVSIVDPSHLWVAAAMAAVSLVLVATRGRMLRPDPAPAVVARPPYRSFEPLHETPVMLGWRVDRRAGARLFAGAALCAWLAPLTIGWHGGELPPHLFVADALLAVACLGLARGYRRPFLATPLAPVLLHLAFDAGVVPEPRTVFGWGVAATAAGFAALAGSLLTTFWLGRRLTPGAESGPPERAP